MNRSTSRLSRQPRRRFFIATTCTALFLLSGLISECLARKPPAQRLKDGEVLTWVEELPNGDRFLRATVLIHAPLKVVWDTVRVARDANLRSSRIEQQVSPRESIVQEEYHLPVIGDVKCRRQIVEYPHERIEFKMLTSDKFKALDGRWVLTPATEGIYVEFWSLVRFAGWSPPRWIFESVGKGKIEKLVRGIKNAAEPHPHSKR